ncbi:MAG: hypothetical protein AAF543_10695 [Pseudomonadota bacterium]
MHQPSRWRRALLATPLIAAGLLSGIVSSEAHNNPNFREVLLVTVDVRAEAIVEGAIAAHSEPFTLDLPKKTIELVWRVAEGNADGVTFGVAQGDALHAEGLVDGANSRILKGGNIRIVNVTGSSGAFSIEIYANVIDRSTSKGS